MEGQNIGNALYGLRYMNSDCVEVKEILEALSPLIEKSPEIMNGQALGNSLYGLQGMHSKEPEVRNLLRILAKKIMDTSHKLKAQEIGNSLYGMKRMSSDVPEVRMIIDALVPKIRSSPEKLDSQAIGNSFYGMQNMKSGNDSIRSLLIVLLDKMESSRVTLDSQAIGNSVYGLQGMDSSEPEVRAIISTLTSIIESSSPNMNTKEVCNALCGLQKMNANCQEVKQLLLLLVDNLSMLRNSYGIQEISNALYGLQSMSSKYEEVRYTLCALYAKLKKNDLIVDPQGLVNCLFGIQSMRYPCTEVSGIIQVLNEKFITDNHPMTSQQIAYAIFGLQGQTNLDPSTNALMNTLILKIASCNDEFTPLSICMILYGINLFEPSEILSSFLSVLTLKIHEMKSRFLDPYWLSAGIYGMQGIKSNSSEANAFILAFIEKIGYPSNEIINQSIGSNSLLDSTYMSTEQISNAFFGLQEIISEENTSAISLISLLMPHFERIVEQGDVFLFSQIANIAYSLLHFDSSHESIKRIYEILGNSFHSDCSATLKNLLRISGQIRTKKYDDMVHYVQVHLSNHLSLFQVISLPNEKSENKLPLGHLRDKLLKLIDFHIRLLNTSEGSMFPESQELQKFISIDGNIISEGDVLTHDDDDDDDSATDKEKDKKRDVTEKTLTFPLLKSQSPRTVLILAEVCADLLKYNSYKISQSVCIEGFSTSVLIWKPCSINENKYIPLLNIEINDESCVSPVSQRYLELRKRFFRDVLGIVVDRVPIDIFMGLNSESSADSSRDTPQRNLAGHISALISKLPFIEEKNTNKENKKYSNWNYGHAMFHSNGEVEDKIDNDNDDDADRATTYPIINTSPESELAQHRPEGILGWQGMPVKSDTKPQAPNSRKRSKAKNSSTMNGNGNGSGNRGSGSDKARGAQFDYNESTVTDQNDNTIEPSSFLHGENNFESNGNGNGNGNGNNDSRTETREYNKSDLNQLNSAPGLQLIEDDRKGGEQVESFGIHNDLSSLDNHNNDNGRTFGTFFSTTLFDDSKCAYVKEEDKGKLNSLSFLNKNENTTDDKYAAKQSSNFHWM